jgi:DNA-directed RNA polymerase specialized sigma subunit
MEENENGEMIPSLISTKRVRTKKSDKNYLNNKEFTDAVTEWILENEGKKKEDWSTMSNYIGESLIKLTNNFGHKRNFSGYTYLDDMKSVALLTCIQYAHNFDPKKSQNAFAYFTQIILNAFRMSLNKEQLQRDIKYKFISEESALSTHNYENICLYDEDAA